MKAQTNQEIIQQTDHPAEAQQDHTSKTVNYKRKNIMKTKQTTKSKFRQIINLMAKVVVALMLIAGGVFLWAYLSTGTSLVARGMMWGDSDAGDLHRFPTRQMQAGESPLMFSPVVKDSLSEEIITVEALGGEQMSFADFLERTNTTAFIVLHGDQLLYERYFNGSDREDIQTSFSAAKAFTSTLVGIALEEGLIRSLEDPITEYLPELIEQDAHFEDITIRHLLNMTSGLRWDRSDSNPFSDDFITYYSPDLRNTALEAEIVESPEQTFVYNDFNPLLIGMVLERATGMSVSEYMETRLWQPMGAEGEGSWSLDSEQSGFEKMFVGVNGRAIDLIKLGWLFLHEGKNGETQVVPQGWVEQVSTADGAIFTNRFEHANYYLNYWFLDVENDAFYAEGDKCQFIYVYPKADLVVARFGTDCGNYVFGLGWVIAVAEHFESQLVQ